MSFQGLTVDIKPKHTFNSIHRLLKILQRLRSFLWRDHRWKINHI